MTKNDNYKGILTPDDRKYLDSTRVRIQRTVINSGYAGSGTSLIVGLFTIIPSIALGPIDFARTAYHRVVGDTPAVKTRLVDYAREGLKEENPGWSTADIESTLARELHVKLDADGRINPSDATISDLWDASEDHAHSLRQQFVWPDFD